MLKGKIILITGGTGSIGKELVQAILKENPAKVRVLSRDQTKQLELLEELGYPKNLRLLIGDIRDKERLNFAFHGVDVVFHAAALKHVPSCEYNPFEAVSTNIIGSQNVIDAAFANGVKRVVAISTDKVVDPTSVMGTTKLMMEKLVINANYSKGSNLTKFSCVRFGNVAWSRGSVLPLWKNQAEKHGVILITNNSMTRFLMSTKQAAELVIEASKIMHGGETFILKMSAISLPDLAKEFIAKYFPRKKIEIKIIGNRAGEKTHEGLLGPGDGDILESKKMLISILKIWVHTGDVHAAKKKFIYRGFKKRKVIDQYNSSDHVDVKAIRKII